MLISLIGALFGCLLAVTFALLQSQFGFLKLGDGNFLVDAYPVEMHGLDFVLVIFTVVIISVISGYWPAKKAADRDIELRVR